MSSAHRPITIEHSRGEYLISSDPSLLSLSAITTAFDSPALYWCKPVPHTVLQAILDNSLNLGLYRRVSTSPTVLATPPKPIQIGLARLITDYVTFAYITDVYVVEEEQGKGLGTWLVECVGEVMDIMGETLRRAMLLSTGGSTQAWYARKLGMSKMEQGQHGLGIMQRFGGGSVLTDKPAENGEGQVKGGGRG